nr:type II toxin-antitoxin system VapC family toxin [uncultured Mucilaginibacter sp.]
MSGKEILVDTNIILHLFDGSEELANFLQGKDIYVSFITELELLGYKSITQKEEEQIVELLDDCSIISMSSLVKEKYIEIKRKYNLKLPDAVIIASAIAFDMPFITADTDSKNITELKLITYQHNTKQVGGKRN